MSTQITDAMIMDYAAATNTEVSARAETWDGSIALLLPKWNIVITADNERVFGDYTGDMFNLYEEVDLSACASIEEAADLLASTTPERL